MTTVPALLPDLRTTLVVAVEVSKTTWVVAAHVPGLHGAKVKQRLERRADALIGAIGGCGGTRPTSRWEPALG